MRMWKRFHEQKSTPAPPNEEASESRHEDGTHRRERSMPLSNIPITQNHWLDMCGHPSTQKGPSSVNTSEIKSVQSRLKRAIEVGIEPALVVPIDRNVPHQLHEQRTKSCARGTSGQEEQEPRCVEADRQPGLQTSSTRGRQSDRLLLSREVPGSGGAVESGGGPLQEQSAAERPASPRPQKKGRSWQLCTTGQRCKTTLRSTKGQRKGWTASTKSWKYNANRA